jgi:hypothetical protein
MFKNFSVLAFALMLSLTADPAHAAVVGVNVVDTAALSAQESAGLIAALKAAGVKTVRAGGTLDELPFITAASRQGIGADLVVPFVGQADRKRHADKALGLTWAATTYSAPDIAGFTAQTRALLDALDKAGIRVTALEFANEINNTQFNGDFDAHGSGRVYGAEDIGHPSTPETQAIHDGFHAYIAELKVLNALRDASKENARTPIISAGLADPGKPGDHPGGKRNSVSIGGTLAILRANGLDSLVQGYGVHVYPSANPNLTEAERAATLEADTFSVCTAPSKPCWLTEWGFEAPARNCPLDDTARAEVARKMHDILAKLSTQGRLAGALYYSWSGHRGVQESPEAIFRCGALTPTGRIALQPF